MVLNFYIFLSSFLLVLVFFAKVESRSFSRQEVKFFLSQLKEQNNDNVKLKRKKGSDEYFCVAQKPLMKGTTIFSVSKENAICAFDLFPFKYEIVKTLKEIKNETGNIDDLTIAQFVLAYNILYLKNNEKFRIQQTVIDKEVRHYYESTKVNKELVDLIPNLKFSALNSKAEHLRILKEHGYNLDDKFQVIELVFSLMLARIHKTKNSEYIYPWISNFREFMNAFAVAVGDGNNIKLDTYEKVTNYNSDTSVHSENDKMNHNFNTKFSSNGAPCLFSLGRVCRQFRSKILREGQARPMRINTRVGYFDIYSDKSLSPNSEILFSYFQESNNLVLLTNSGEILQNNVWDYYGISVKHGNSTFTKQQFNLCRELGCISQNEKFEKQSDKIFFKVYKNIFSDELLNYGRTLFLKKDFDYQKVLKTFLSSTNNIWTYMNEVRALLHYYEEMDKYDITKKSTQNAQKHRNLQKQTKDEFKKNFFHKLAELIYKFDLNYKTILLRHKAASLSRVVKLTRYDINRLVQKMLSKTKKKK